jgi:hypothetical protein
MSCSHSNVEAGSISALLFCVCPASVFFFIFAYVVHQMGLGGGMDESFEDPGSFDDDDCEEDEGEGGQLQSWPAPDLSSLLSVSPLVRFDDYVLLFY